MLLFPELCSTVAFDNCISSADLGFQIKIWSFFHWLLFPGLVPLLLSLITALVLGTQDSKINI